MGIILDLSALSISAQQISGSLVNSQIADLAASKITGTLTNSQIADLAGSKLTGTVPASVIDAAIARLASPALTGSPTAPTPATGNQSTAIATTAYADPGHNFTPSSGGQKFGSGFIINWGYVAVGDHPGGGFGGQTGSATFTYAYPSTILGLVACIYDTLDTASIILSTSAWSNSGFNWATSEMGALTQDYYVFYISVGC